MLDGAKLDEVLFLPLVGFLSLLLEKSFTPLPNSALGQLQSATARRTRVDLLARVELDWHRLADRRELEALLDLQRQREVQGRHAVGEASSRLVCEGLEAAPLPILTTKFSFGSMMYSKSTSL